MNLAENLSRCAAATPDAPAIKLDDVVLSYTALDAASARVAGLLAARGVTAGDRIGIMLPNVPYFPVAYYGILRLGAVVVPMNVLLKGRETAFYLKDPGAKAVFAWADFAEHAQTGAEHAGAECIEVAPGAFEQLLATAEPLPEVVPRDGAGQRGDPLHVRHDRHAEGRRALACQPRAQLRGVDRPVHDRRRKR